MPGSAGARASRPRTRPGAPGSAPPARPRPDPAPRAGASAGQSEPSRTAPDPRAYTGETTISVSKWTLPNGAGGAYRGAQVMTTDEYRELMTFLGTKFGEMDSRF